MICSRNASIRSVLITGGAGLIGSATIDQLLLNPIYERILVVDNMIRGSRQNIQHALESGRVELVEGDIRDRLLLQSLMQNVDSVFHMAALRITACAENPREAFDVMCTGTFNVIDAASQAGVSKIVAASSASIYGLADIFPTPEHAHPYDNKTFYGTAKLMLEGMLRSHCDMYGLPYIALRYFNVFGPRMDIHGKYTEVLIRWMERIERGEPPVIFGDGNQTMDFIYIDDIARANVIALESPVTDQVFNVASGTETSLLQLVMMLLQVMGRQDLGVEFAPERSINPVPRRLADISKARDLLGFEATTPLYTGLKKLVEWWRENRKKNDSCG